MRTMQEKDMDLLRGKYEELLHVQLGILDNRNAETIDELIGISNTMVDIYKTLYLNTNNDESKRVIVQAAKNSVRAINDDINRGIQSTGEQN